MAASTGSSKGPELSKAEYLKRYLSADGDDKKSKGKLKKKRRKVPEKGLKIVDDDIDWKQMVKEEAEVEEDEEEAPVIAEVIDDRPEEVKQLEAFRTSNRWKVIGADDEEDKGEGEDGEPPEPAASSRSRHDSPDASPPRRSRHDSPDASPPRRSRHDSPDASPPRRSRHDSPDASPPRRSRHDSPDSPPRKSGKAHSKDSSPRRKPSSSSSSKKRSDPQRSPQAKRAQNRHDSDSDQSPPRKKTLKGEASDSDQSPPRKTGRGSDSDQSPPRRRARTGKDSDEDLSPPRRSGQGPRMLSGGTAGLVSIDVLRKEQEENRRRERNNQPLEDQSRNAQTIFRDKSGKKRDLDSEREEQRKKAGEKAAKDEKYAQWGRGLAQSQMQQQKLEDAVHEAQKPLARHRDDEDLDRMLREQEREGDPMAAMLRRKKDRNPKTQAKPQYKGPAPPPNRFNILPGYRWDGVDRSNGFEKKRYMRMADKKAVQEAAYKWSVEDM
ncbi:BUD13-like protein [Nibea albiflora]|uniref:BUD13-like protein n=1 Tax=Nibea albiflora TaxID=240163 RepID=A0ACB7F2A2_NIBAL|nr:BUD13-like protein [Nibea albiflora]